MGRGPRRGRRVVKSRRRRRPSGMRVGARGRGEVHRELAFHRAEHGTGLLRRRRRRRRQHPRVRGGRGRMVGMMGRGMSGRLLRLRLRGRRRRRDGRGEVTRVGGRRRPPGLGVVARPALGGVTRQNGVYDGLEPVLELLRPRSGAHLALGEGEVVGVVGRLTSRVRVGRQDQRGLRLGRPVVR